MNLVTKAELYILVWINTYIIQITFKIDVISFSEENDYSWIYLFTLPFKYEESQNVPTFRGVLAHPPKSWTFCKYMRCQKNTPTTFTFESSIDFCF